MVVGRPPPVPSRELTAEERRWLHDKYERLAAEEGQLAAGRTSYFAAIGSVLVTGTVVAVAYFNSRPGELALVVSFLSAIGVVISSVWAVLLHRTNDAQALWREAARLLEESQPPLDGSLEASVPLRSGRSVTVDLLRPYAVHRQRFARSERLGWLDRVSPARLTEFLPLAFLGIWVAVAVYAWVWYLVS